MHLMPKRLARALGIWLIGLCAHATADELTGSALLEALRAGGNTLVMRHASAPAEPPNDSIVEKENRTRERQLDDSGKSDARAIGVAIKRLRIPITEIQSSPTFRARQTVVYAAIGAPKIVAQLDEATQDMASAATAPNALWLKRAVGVAAPSAANVLLVTHSPNIRGAFGINADQGEVLVVRAQQSSVRIVGRIKPKDWAQFTQ